MNVNASDLLDPKALTYSPIPYNCSAPHAQDVQHRAGAHDPDSSKLVKNVH